MNGSAHGDSPGPRRFPPGFVWGASTSAYQIEGALAEDGRGRSIWESFCEQPGAIHGGETAAVACDSYHRFGQDIALLRELGVGAYRLSISWPRVQPDGRGPVNRAGLDYYRRLLAALREHDIAPVVTVYHWELPEALEQAGGWPVRDTAQRLAEYAGLLAAELGDEVAMWITVNEPRQPVHQGYRVGTHAPGRRDGRAAAAATHHLLLGHGLAVRAIRAASSAPAGVTIDLNQIRPAGPGAEAVAIALDAELNRLYLDPVLHGRYPDAARAEMLPPAELIEDGDLELIATALDFLGINYYSPHYVRLGDWSDLRRGETPLAGHPGAVSYLPPELPRTVMDWLVEPEGLYDLLMRLRAEAPGLPLYVTENGCACEDYPGPDGEVNDFERIAYLHGHLDAAWRAIRDGVPLAGYFHWSLMDNFEWAWGYARRFGLYYVDFGTQQRRAKRSAAFYAGVLRSGELPARHDVLTSWDRSPRAGSASAPAPVVGREQTLAHSDGATPAAAAGE
jgi:beta-glucosidase